MIYFERMDFAEHYHIEGKDRDVMRGPFQAKHINKSTACILKICESEGSEVNITSCKKSTIISLYQDCRLIMDIILCKDQRENFKSLISNT